MNKFKKVGLSALAGSLVAMSAQAAEYLSGGASLVCTKSQKLTKHCSTTMTV